MRRMMRLLVLSGLGLGALTGCEATGPFGKLDLAAAGASADGKAGSADGKAVDPVTTGAVGPAGATVDLTAATPPGLTGSRPVDPVSVGKRHFREGQFGLAEEAFRKAVELGPRDAEAWVGLAASYDRLRRFDLADRAYAQAIRLVGQTAVILNNQGYSYMLRGDLKKARAKLAAALAKDPGNPTIAANLAALDASLKLGKDVR